MKLDNGTKKKNEKPIELNESYRSPKKKCGILSVFFSFVYSIESFHRQKMHLIRCNHFWSIFFVILDHCCSCLYEWNENAKTPYKILILHLLLQIPNNTYTHLLFCKQILDGSTHTHLYGFIGPMYNIVMCGLSWFFFWSTLTPTPTPTPKKERKKFGTIEPFHYYFYFLWFISFYFGIRDSFIFSYSLMLFSWLMCFNTSTPLLYRLGWLTEWILV